MDESKREYFSKCVNSSRSTSSICDSIIILDRTVDLITPLRSQLTYEGIIDELYSIKSSILIFNLAFVELDQSFLTKGIKSKKILLNSADPVFRDIRDQVLVNFISRALKVFLFLKSGSRSLD